MAGKTKPGSALKGINIKLKMINDLMDVTGSAKDSWNPAEISDDMKAIAYIHRLADTWNPAQLNEALKYLGFDTIDSWNPAIIEETKNKLVKYFLPTEATGNPITFKTYGNFPYEVSKAEVTFLPKQDLHGYDSPWVGGAGKNKFNYEWITDIGCHHGTVSTSANGNITITATSNDAYTEFVASHWDNAYRIAVKENDVVRLSWNKSGATGRCGIFLEGDTNFGYKTIENSTGLVTYTIPEGVTFVTIRFGVSNSGESCTYSNVMVTVNNSSTDYATYSNICPISGRNSVTLTVNGDDTEITFEDTVYGGTVNVIEGGTSSIYGYIASYDGEELPGAWISDRDAYVAGTDPTTGAEVVYVLTTPTELTTPANEIALVNGVNTLSTDGDNIVIEYKALLNS